jgi:uncharacterized protein
MRRQEEAVFPFVREFHIFPHREKFLVFHPGSFSLFRINPAFAAVLEECRSGGDLHQAAENLGVSWHALEARLTEMADRISRAGETARPTAYDDSPEREVGLTLHVSNACNLDCLYCYAQGGDYGGRPQRRMDKDLALKAIDRMYQNFPNIVSVMFFGGEPLLALDVIEGVCRHIEDKYERGKIGHLPQYKMVTNGTLVTDEAVRVIHDYKIQVTISVDGPQEINDRLRPYKNGKGTYGAIRQGFDRIARETGQTPCIEATFTRYHLDQGMSMKSLIEFLHREFLFTVGTVADVSVPEDNPLAVPKDALREEIGGAMDSLVMGLARGDVPMMERSFLFPILNFIRKRGTRFTCSVAHDGFDITAEGEIYPCQIFIGKEEFRMGTVDDFDYRSPTPQLLSVLDRLIYADKERNPICAHCWARSFCVSCPGTELFASNGYLIPEGFCRNMYDWVERVLARLYDIRSNPQLWLQFLEGIKVLARQLEERMPPPLANSPRKSGESLHSIGDSGVLPAG